MKLATQLAWMCLTLGMGVQPMGTRMAESSVQPLIRKSAVAGTAGCRKLVLTGEVSSGQQWSAPIGEGWIFRMVPIAGGQAVDGQIYSGWDLVVDRENGGGYPDALLLATPPYGSLSEREIGTTFGLRAQDAVGWNPRQVHFLHSVADLERARGFFRQITGPQASRLGAAEQASVSKELLDVMKNASTGEFTVLDARFSAGTADPPVYAQQWALRLRQIPHTVVEAEGEPSARGTLRYLRFALTLWLPARWVPPAGRAVDPANCAQ